MSQSRKPRPASRCQHCRAEQPDGLIDIPVDHDQRVAPTSKIFAGGKVGAGDPERRDIEICPPADWRQSPIRSLPKWARTRSVTAAPPVISSFPPPPSARPRPCRRRARPCRRAEIRVAVVAGKLVVANAAEERSLPGRPRVVVVLPPSSNRCRTAPACRRRHCDIVAVGAMQAVVAGGADDRVGRRHRELAIAD